MQTQSVKRCCWQAVLSMTRYDSSMCTCLHRMQHMPASPFCGAASQMGDAHKNTAPHSKSKWTAAAADYLGSDKLLCRGEALLLASGNASQHGAADESVSASVQAENAHEHLHLDIRAPHIRHQLLKFNILHICITVSRHLCLCRWVDMMGHVNASACSCHCAESIACIKGCHMQHVCCLKRPADVDCMLDN